MKEERIYISRSNAKLGPHIPAINLPAGKTCRKDAPCLGKCYARKGNMAFRSVKNRAEANLALWIENPVQYEKEIMETAYHSRFFRLHCSGDIPDATYLDMMFRAAKVLLNTSFLVFTKQWEFINNSLNYVERPHNLQVVLSA